MQTEDDKLSNLPPDSRDWIIPGMGLCGTTSAVFATPANDFVGVSSRAVSRKVSGKERGWAFSYVQICVGVQLCSDLSVPCRSAAEALGTGVLTGSNSASWCLQPSQPQSIISGLKK